MPVNRDIEHSLVWMNLKQGTEHGLKSVMLWLNQQLILFYWFPLRNYWSQVDSLRCYSSQYIDSEQNRPVHNTMRSVVTLNKVGNFFYFKNLGTKFVQLFIWILNKYFVFKWGQILVIFQIADWKNHGFNFRVNRLPFLKNSKLIIWHFTIILMILNPRVISFIMSIYN